MIQKELDAMTPADLLGLWSARREGRYEDPRPGEVQSNCPQKHESLAVDDEMYVAAWVDSLPQIQRYRRALVLIFAGGLMPQQAAEHRTLVRQTSAVRLRTWQKWSKEWGIRGANPLRVGLFVIGQALDAIREAQKTNAPKLPSRPQPMDESRELAGQTADVNEKAEAKFPLRWRARAA